MRSSSLAVFTIVGIVACGSHRDDAGPARVYVASGEDDDGGVSIALLVEDGRVKAYVCSDDPARDEYPRWLDGAIGDDGVARAARDGWTLTATLRGDDAEVALAGPQDRTIAWRAVRGAGLEGLYAVDDSGCTTGVVVVEDGAGTTVRGAWCDAQGQVLQVTPTRPIALVAGRLAVDVAAPVARRLFVAPVTHVSP